MNSINLSKNTFTEICEYLDANSLLATLKTCKQFSKWGKDNSRINQVFLKHKGYIVLLQDVPKTVSMLKNQLVLIKNFKLLEKYEWATEQSTGCTVAKSKAFFKGAQISENQLEIAAAQNYKFFFMNRSDVDYVCIGNQTIYRFQGQTQLHKAPVLGINMSEIKAVAVFRNTDCALLLQSTKQAQVFENFSVKLFDCKNLKEICSIPLSMWSFGNKSISLNHGSIWVKAENQK